MIQRRSLLRGFAALSMLPALSLLPRGQAALALTLGKDAPATGEAAPPFSLEGVAPSSSGSGASPTPVRLGLADFRGQWLVLYFYPKDFTSGCTIEARGFQRDLDLYKRRQAVVVGVSSDSAKSHDSFCGAEGLAYPLLSDPDGAVSRRYGSWLAPSALRNTFLIDPDGVVRARWLGVRPLGHSQEILQMLASLQDGGSASA